MDKICMISTIDNPFNPFEDYDEWYRYDLEKGYDSCSKLARIAYYPDGMSEVEAARETERAIDSIIKNDFLSIFIKVEGPSLETVD